MAAALSEDMKMDIDPVGVFRLEPSSFYCVRGSDACCGITGQSEWEDVFDFFEDDDKDDSSAVWGVDPLELDYSFELLSEIYFENPLTAGEGFALVLQRESSNLLGATDLLGYGGIASAQPVVEFEGAPGKVGVDYQWKVSMPHAAHAPSMHFPIDLAAGGAEFAFKYNEVLHEFKLFIDGEEAMVGEINLEELMKHDEVIWGFTYSGESCVEQNVNPMSLEVIDDDLDEALDMVDEEEDEPVKIIDVPDSPSESEEDETPKKDPSDPMDYSPRSESDEDEEETPAKPIVPDNENETDPTKPILPVVPSSDEEEEETPVKPVVPDNDNETDPTKPILPVVPSSDETGPGEDETPVIPVVPVTPVDPVPPSQDETPVVPVVPVHPSEDLPVTPVTPIDSEDLPSMDLPSEDLPISPVVPVLPVTPVDSEDLPSMDLPSMDEIRPQPVTSEDLPSKDVVLPVKDEEEDADNETYESVMILNETFEKEAPWSFVNNLFGAVGCPADQMLGLLGAKIGREGAKGLRVRLLDEPLKKKRVRTAAGYQHEFQLDKDVYNAQVLLSFKTDKDKAFTDQDKGEVVVELDGVEHTAFRCSGPECTSEWQDIRINLGALKAGFHSLQIGSVLKTESEAVGEKARRFDIRVDNIRLKTVKPRGMDLDKARKIQLLKDLEKELAKTAEDGEEAMTIEAILDGLREQLDLAPRRARPGKNLRGGMDAKKKGSLMEKIQNRINRDEDKEHDLEKSILVLQKKKEALGEAEQDKVGAVLDGLKKRVADGGAIEDKTGELLDQLIDRMTTNEKREKELQSRLETRMKMHESKIENLSNNMDILEDAIDDINGESSEDEGNDGPGAQMQAGGTQDNAP